ncbi:MAG TPA: amidohydrolase family protein [Solirubrobacterales bacterium]|jgi:predicted TIM-barrel fold metal-dependent hydrolase
MAGTGAIDVHAHHLPGALLDALRRREEPPCVRAGGEPDLLDCGGGLAYPLIPPLLDLGVGAAQRAELEIDLQLLSAPPPGVAGLPRAEAAAIARAANDELAAAGAGTRALAVLPLEHPDDAVAELERAAAAGHVGGQLLSNAGGEPLEVESHQELFEAAARLDLPLVIHPTLPIDRGAVAAHGLMTTLGFVFDTSACAARLVLGGLFERWPGLKLLLPHAGATLTPLLARFDYELDLMALAPLSTPPSEQLRLLYLDSICDSPAALCLALEEFGTDRVLYGSDEPFWGAERGLAVVDEALAGDTEGLGSVRRGNAERLFRLD